MQSEERRCNLRFLGPRECRSRYWASAAARWADLWYAAILPTRSVPSRGRFADGVNYFDTAVQYGNGESEKNLGRVLQRLKPANVAVGTKVRLPPSECGRIADAVKTSLEGSLARLRLDRVDILHLHNAITETGGGSALSVRQVLGDVVPAFERLRRQGKTRFLGITAVEIGRAHV